MKRTSLYNTIKFRQIYPTVDDFISDYGSSGFPENIKITSVTTLFYLLLGRYANNPIANRDITQWKLKLWSIVYQYGPTWEKRGEIQEKLRKLDDKEIVKGTKAINNRAYNPDTKPGTASLEELAFINDQTTSTMVRSQLEGLNILMTLLEEDVSEDFLVKFRRLFKLFVNPENVLLYGEDLDSHEDDVDLWGYY
jgi:hypothetical protein